MEFGLYTFADVMPDPATGRVIGPAERLANLLEEVELAEQVGLDVIAIGEHHRPDFAVSAPAVVLGAIAARTTRIRLSSAVSVLSSDDPVRVFQAFATLDLLSNGRAEIMAGRGSFIESFGLFGYDLRDYEELFSEKLDLLLTLREHERVTWQGRHRAPLDDIGVYPRPIQDPLPVWIAIGGTPRSAARAGLLGLPLALAIIGGAWDHFGPAIELYRRAWAEAGRAGEPTVGINAHGHIARDGRRAREELYPAWHQGMSTIGSERGWPPPSRSQYDAQCTLRGALIVGTPEEVAEKIVAQHRLFGHRRFLLQPSVGGAAHAKALRTIELLGTEVAPLVRAELGVSAG